MSHFMRFIKAFITVLILTAAPLAANAAGLFSYDTMTDTAGTVLSSHTGQTGATWTKTGSATGDGVFTPANRVRTGNAGGNEAFYKTSGVPAGADYDVQGDFYFPDTAQIVTLAARQNGGAIGAGTGGYLGGWNNTSGWQIFNGLTPVATTAGSPTGTHVVRFSLRGTTLTLYVDGVSTVTATDSTYASTGTAGLFFFTNGGATDTSGPQVSNFGAIDAGSLAAGILSDSTITSTGGTFAMTTPIGGVYNYTYQLQRSAHGAGTYSNVGSALTAQFGSAAFTDATASAGTSYDYRIVVTDSTGGTPLTANSNVVNITTSGAGPATTYTLSGPSSGATGAASTNFTVQAVGTPSGTVTVTPHSTGTGTFSPTTVTLAATLNSSATFTYTPSTSTTATITTTNNLSLTDPAGVSYTSSSSSATSYTFTAPSPRMGVRGSASGNFTITPVGGNYTGTITVTPSGGGLSSPITLTFSGSSSAQTFTITPTAKGVVTLTPTASPALGTDPLPLSYVSLPKVNIVPVGDSLTAGTNASSGLGTCAGTVYPGVLMTQLQGANSFYACTNNGVAGQTMATMLANASSVMLPAYDGTKDINIAIVQACTNDIGAGVSAATCWANTSSYITTLKGYGYKVVIQTITPSGYSGYIANFNTPRDQYNNLIRTNWSGLADAISDTAADSRIGFDGTQTNATYYNGSDLTHLTDAGYAIIAGYATGPVQAIIDGQTSGGGAPAGIVVGMLMAPF